MMISRVSITFLISNVAKRRIFPDATMKAAPGVHLARFQWA
jgi:hypothetical protein